MDRNVKMSLPFSVFLSQLLNYLIEHKTCLLALKDLSIFSLQMNVF